MTDLDRTDDAPDVAAAEFALGLLEGDERAAALRRMLAEPAFARDVERWRGQFAALFASIPSVEPEPALAERVMAERVLARAPGPVSTGYWKPLAIAASLAAVSLLGLNLVRPQPAAPPAAAVPAPMVAAFMIDGHQTPLVATYDSAHGRLSMPGPMPIPAGKSAQLWAIVGADAPQPLGLFHQAGARVEAEARTPRPMRAGTTFAISIEPLGGSPTGAPTGPVVGSATLIRA
jgi:anti-sigma-K factor RskA